MNGFVSVRQIADNIMSHPLMKDVPFERIINYTAEFIRIMGCNDLFVEKTAKVEIENQRGVLPCDYIRILGVRLGDRIVKSATDTFHLAGGHAFGNDITYKIQGKVIFLSKLPKGKDEIEVAYQAMALDEDGFPLVPDNASFVKALELYIKKEVFTILFELGKIHQYIFNDVIQEYTYYAAQAKTSLDMPDYDQMEIITRNTLIPRSNLHAGGFKDLTN